MKNPLFDDIFGNLFGSSGTVDTEIRAIVKCPTCGQKNRLPPNVTSIKAGPLGPKCGRCKQSLVLT